MKISNQLDFFKSIFFEETTELLHPVPSHAEIASGYDLYIVALSGGKDSIACLCHLLDIGVDPAKIELHHHDIDGAANTFMDWPVTLGYVKAIARHFGLRLAVSYREGGFYREMMRDNQATAAVVFEATNGETIRVGGDSDKLNTRLMFPQVSADLKVRWCSGKVKIDVMDAVLRNDPTMQGKRILVVTGERAQESTNRARYKVFEPHRVDPRTAIRQRLKKAGKTEIDIDGFLHQRETAKAKIKSRRHVDHLRPVHGWSEEQVWAIIRKFGIVPHVAYQLGWGRLSCRCCIFGSANQWATIRLIFPDAFEAIARHEDLFGKTIQRNLSVRQMADRGQPYAVAAASPELVALANQTEWTLPIVVDPANWIMPAGAFGESNGPV